MKKYLQTPRYRWFFYSVDSASTVDDWGVPTTNYTLITTGYFSYERARRPVEITDAATTVPETQYVLMGAFSPHYHTSIKNNHIAWCPHLNKIVEVIGDPVDDTGMRERLAIFVVDNVERTIDTGSLPTS